MIAWLIEPSKKDITPTVCQRWEDVSRYLSTVSMGAAVDGSPFTIRPVILLEEPEEKKVEG